MAIFLAIFLMMSPTSLAEAIIGSTWTATADEWVSDMRSNLSDDTNLYIDKVDFFLKNAFSRLRNPLKGEIKDTKTINSEEDADKIFDKTFQKNKDLEIAAFEKAFTQAKAAVVEEARQKGYDVPLTKKHLKDAVNPNDPANYYYLMCAANAIYYMDNPEKYEDFRYNQKLAVDENASWFNLLTSLIKQRIKNKISEEISKKDKENSLEYHFDQMPHAEYLCPYTTEVATEIRKKKVKKDGKEVEEEEEIKYLEATFYPYTQVGAFKAFGYDINDCHEAWQSSDESIIESYTLGKLADAFMFTCEEFYDYYSDIDMHKDIDVPYDYEEITITEIERSDDEGNKYVIVNENGEPLTAIKVTYFASNDEFINLVAPIIAQYCKENGWVCVEGMIAQICLETGYGGSQLSSMYYNFGGIKATGSWLEDPSRYVVMKTKEQDANGNEYTVDQPFRRYASFEEGIRGYLDHYATSKNYPSVGKQLSVEDFGNYLCGGNERGVKYATDVNYTAKLKGVAEAYGLSRFNSISLYD